MSSENVSNREETGGQLMKDCNELRRRLVLTEESLRSLGSEQDSMRSIFGSSSIGFDRPSFERPQSESGYVYQGATPKARLDLDQSTLLSPSRTVSLPSLAIKDSSNKFSTDLSNAAFQHKQMNEKISFLAQTIKEKDFQIRDLHRVIDEKDSDMDKISSEISMADDDLRKEVKLRKSIEEKLRESLYAGEELREKMIDLMNHIHLTKETNSEDMDRLKITLEEIENDRIMLTERNEKLKSSLRCNDSLREENQILRSELKAKEGIIAEFQARLASFDELHTVKEDIRHENEDLRRENEDLHHENEDLRHENDELRNETEVQQNKIEDFLRDYEKLKASKEDIEANMFIYEEDLGKANEEIARLEKCHAHVPKGSDQGNNVSQSSLNEHTQDGMLKISMAEAELKLALKDAEIHKLKAALLARAATNSKVDNLIGENDDNGTNGLRSEFAAFLERNKIGNRKQQDLERIISHLEDEVAKHSDEIMILEERLTDKMSYISLLEGKLEQKNSKMSSVQEEMKRQIEAKSELEKQLQARDLNLQKAEKELRLCTEKLSECTKQIENFESLVSDKMKSISYLENSVKMKDSEGKQANSLIEKMKNMHLEHCQELQFQIDSLQEQVDVRNLEATNLQANFTVLQQELDLKTSVCLDLETKLNETTTQLEERALTLTSYKEKLKKLSGHLQSETSNVEHLEGALSSCKEELKAILEQSERNRKRFTDDAVKQREKFEKLQAEHNNAVLKNEAKMNELNDALSRLKSKDEAVRNLNDKVDELQGTCRKLKEEKDNLDKYQEDETKRFENTMSDVKSKVDQLLSELDVKGKENVQLRISLEEVQMKSELVAERRDELEKLTEKLNEEKKSQMSITKSFQIEVKEKETSNKTLLKKFHEIKRKCASEESLHLEATSKVKELEKELATVHSELRQTVDDLSRLQTVLSENEREIQSKDEAISVMDRKLNESQEHIQSRDALLKEQSAKLSFMDKSIKEQQLELKQKAVEVTQLDMSMKEQHSQLQYRLNNTEEQLRGTTQELSESLSQIAELQAKVEFTEEKFEAKNSEISNMQQKMQQQMDKLKEQSVNEMQMQQEISVLRSQVDKLRHVEEQLEFLKEENQRMLVEIRRLQTEFSKKHQMEEELTRELDECHLLLQSKEADCTRLAKNLGASQVREAEQEAKWMQEVQKVKKNLEFKNIRQQQEADKSSSDQSKRLGEREKQIVGLQAKVQHVVDENKLLKNDLERCRKRITDQSSDVKAISAQLQEQQQFTDDLKENALIKDAEITRLEARLSGYQRSSYGVYGGKLNSSFN